MNVTDIMVWIPALSDTILKGAGVIFILIASVVVGKGLTIYLRRYFKDRVDKDHLNILMKVIYYGIITLAVLVFIFPILDIEASSLLVAGGVVGIVIGFASQSIVGNFISGLFLMTERPITIGDQVNISDNAGYVEDINMISTVIRTYDGLYVRVPNEIVFTTNITNYVANMVRRFDYVVGIRYEDDAERAIDIIQEILDREPFVLRNPPAGIFVDKLGDNSVNILVRIWAPVSEWYELKTRMLWIIKKALGENGIEIPFPQRTVWFASELQTKRISPAENEPIENEGTN
ncbi:MAG: mechanosensitive ion channel family protein [Methanosarcinaceae archaeon]|nr:mechanosensitive ion channel family protein [Methanosarcinaceae archaeon]